jgi:hypothetical protein
VPLGRIPEFVRSHADSLVACFDVGQTFWAVEAHLRAAGDHTARDALWGVARDNRLYDVGLLDLLLEEALSASDLPAPRDLSALAERYHVSYYAGLTAAGESGSSVRPDLTTGSAEALAARDAASVFSILRGQFLEVDKIIQELGIETETYGRYGLLSVGLQTRGAIALAHVNRRGLRLHRDAVAGLGRLGDRVYRESSRALHDDKRARKCFRWEGDAVRSTKRGQPDQKPWQLRQWLAAIASAPSTFNIPLEPPRTPDGEVSTSPEFWGDLALVDPGLRDWSRLWAAAEIRKALDEAPPAGPILIRPRYDLFPRLTSRGPDLNRLRRLAADPRFGALNADPDAPPVRGRPSEPRRAERRPAPGPALFEAEPGHALAVGRFPDLVPRCHAQVCERDGGASQLGGFLRVGTDPVQATAKRLYMRARLDAGEDDGCGGAGFAAEFDELCEQGASPVGPWLDLARGLLDVIPRGLNVAHLREVLWADYGVDVSAEDAERYSGWLVEILPDLGWMVNVDTTVEVASRNLGCSVAELDGVLPQGPAEAAAAALRNVAGGRRPDPALFERLRAVCGDDHWKERLAAGRGSQDLYRDLFAGRAVSPVGRVRCGVFLTRGRAALHLSLADDAVAAALFALVADGFDLIGWDGREFAVQIPDGVDPEPVLSEIRQSAERGAQGVVTIFPPRCEVRRASAW